MCAWFEAVAFCQWLTATIGPQHVAPLRLLLPTDQEWQRAAQGDDNRTYPWGNNFDKRRCNAVESGIGQPTPVTQYPNGASPYGVIDMVGNVFEWCLTEARQDTNELSGRNDRVMRGGSFDVQDFTRVTSRDSYSSAYRDPSIGFRVVFSPPST